ncbi:ribosome hibernation-promoting factor, HPF/YfiA family [Microbaculum marinisediminis]|uniref:Ribosome-associated translation inhibitor RaiA n=1 Tax=Microbaculum marinisediminis TaxID=2931392 RepID=A0AAW5QZA2_9HYPH|nr:ribosome-associated translation inhibitor RaiA [Microbaculum sp. A6E488]MCT8973262.1 ribosome-associated translation inhibitor RaiA [Microbaculum sp. A6E488]
METPVEIAFRNMDPSEFVEKRVRERVGRLEQFYDRITSCHVQIEAPHKHHTKGNLYEIRIEVRVPGTELTVNNKPGNVHAHEDIYVAIRDAFDAMERQLKKWKQKANADVKVHDAPLAGRIEELHPDRDFGQIAMTDGRLVYFHRNSVVGNGFDTLSLGDTVELVVHSGEGEKGPQASAVRPVGGLKFVDKP